MVNFKTLLFTSILAVAPVTQAEILYDVSLPSDVYADGQVLLANSGKDTPSRVVFGSQEVRHYYAGLNGNSVVFNSPVCPQYDQIAFDLPDNQSEVYFEADIYTENLNGSDNSFSILTDAGTTRSLSFHGGLGTLRFFHSGVASPSLFNFSDNTEYNVKIYANGITDVFTITVNGVEGYSGILGAPALTSFRLNLSPWTGAPSVCGDSNVAVRNIKIYESPEDLIEEPVETFDLSMALYSNPEVPAAGGRLHYGFVINNADDVAHSQTHWVSINLPSGEQYPIFYQRRQSVILPGDYLRRTGSVRIPRWIPAGDYEFKLVVVDTGSGEVQTTSIPFTKLEM